MFLGSISIVTFMRNWEKNSKDDSTFRVWALFHETFSTLLPNCPKVRLSLELLIENIPISPKNYCPIIDFMRKMEWKKCFKLCNILLWQCYLINNFFALHPRALYWARYAIFLSPKTPKNHYFEQ